jgi:hypothetical protein
LSHLLHYGCNPTIEEGDTKILDEVPPTDENPRGYPPFDMSFVPNYSNKQLTYYYTTGAIAADEQPRFHQPMKQRKISLGLLGWDGESNSGNEGNDDIFTADDSGTSTDSDCPAPLLNFKGITIFPSSI